MEARRNAEKNMSGDAVAFHLNPKHPFRELQYTGGSTAKSTGKNHSKQNRELIKEMQRKTREKAERESEQKPMFRMKKFTGVESKLVSFLKESPGSQPQAKFDGFLRKGAGTCRRLPSGERSPSRATLPKATSEGDLEGTIKQIGGLQIGEAALRNSRSPTPKASAPTRKNFVLQNMKSVIEAQPPLQTVVEDAPITESMGFGRVPLYIHKRKLELAQKQEQKRLQKEKDKLPPGMTLMSEEERQKTVQLLLENQQKLLGELAKMPLTIETPSLMEKHNKINAKIIEVENALKLFNRKKVYITA